MTAQEKAIDLLDYFTKLTPPKLSDYSKIYLPTAKLCAIRVVDEVLDTCNVAEIYEYYLEVKEHIEGM